MCEKGQCHGEAVRYVLAKVRGEVFASLHAVAANHRSRTGEFTLWPVGTGALRYHNCCIECGTSPEYFWIPSRSAVLNNVWRPTVLPVYALLVESKSLPLTFLR
jgi:hypothetical protein